MRITKDLHVHTELSKDAQGTIDEIASEAKKMGLQSFAITNHSFGHPYGMEKKDYEKLKEDCKRVGAIFGIEADLLNKKGDIDTGGLAFEHVVVGFHKSGNWLRYLFGTKKGNTQMYINAINKNKIDIIAHLNSQIRVNCAAVCQAAAAKGVLIELNNKSKLRYTPEEFAAMQATGVKFIINSDAHSPEKVGKPERVFEFLKTVEFNPKQIVNLEM